MNENLQDQPVSDVQIQMQFHENRRERLQEGKRWTEWIDGKEWLSKLEVMAPAEN